MPAPTLDALDHQLIDLLSRDARVSNRKIAAELGVTEGTVRGRIKRLQQDGLIVFTAVTGFEMARKSRLSFINVQADVDKVRDIIGLYLSPPTRAIVLSVDEKSQIQALDREQPVLPMMPGCRFPLRA